MIVQYESSLRAVGYCTVPRERVRVESTAHGSRVHTSQTHQIVSAQWAPRVGPDVQCARAPTRLWRTTKRNSRRQAQGPRLPDRGSAKGQGGRVSVHTAPTRHTPSLHAAVLSGRLCGPRGPPDPPGSASGSTHTRRRGYLVIHSDVAEILRFRRVFLFGLPRDDRSVSFKAGKRYSTDSYGVARWSVNDDLMIRWNR